MGEIIYETSNKIGKIIIKNPERRNALDPNLLSEITSAFEQSRRNGDLSVIFTSYGRDFSVGLDLKYMKTILENKNLMEYIKLVNSFQNVTKAILSHPGIIIAGLRGYVIGGAFEITLGCDLRIAATDTRILMPEVGIGTMLTNASTKLLPRIVGESRAKEIVFLKESIEVHEALNLGLVNQVVEPEKLDYSLEEIAKKIVKKAPLSIYFAKKLINENQDLDLEKALEREFIANLICDLSSDFEEGVKAFFERREPRFTKEIPSGLWNILL